MKASQFYLLPLILFSLLILQVNGNDGFVREWQAINGVVLAGKFIKFDKNSNLVTLKLASNDKESEFSIEKLSDVDKSFVRLQDFIREDREQFEKVSEHLENLRSTPDTTILILKELAKIFPNSPYASVWGAVASGSGLNQLDDAIKLSTEGIKRIRAQREHDSSRHARTLVSAYNNLAVSHIKKRNADEAARFLLEALELVERTPPVLSHNVRFLNELATEKGAIKLDKKYKDKLISAIARLPIEDSKKKLADGWYYSLDLDVPSSLENELSIAGVHPPDPTLELIASGTGFVCAPGYVVTVRPAVIHPHRSASLATVAVPIGKSRWMLKPAQRVFATSPRKRVISGADTIAESTTVWREGTRVENVERSSATNLSLGAGAMSDSTGINSSNATLGVGVNEGTTTVRGAVNAQGVSQTRTLTGTTNYVLDNPIDGTAEAELAILRIDNLKLEPCVFVDNAVRSGDRVAGLGFQRGPEMLKSGQKLSGGSVLSVQSLNHFTIDTPILGGMRGGPCVDKFYRVVGLAWATGNSPVGGHCYTGSAIKSWFASTSQTADLTFVASADQTSYEERLKAATIPILVWGRRSDLDMSNPIYSQFYNEDNLMDRFVIRDDWCFRCGGDGVAQCQRCSGMGTITNGYKSIVVGRNPATGQLMEQQVPNKVVCSNCNGRKGVTCSECVGGKLPGNANLNVSRP